MSAAKWYDRYRRTPKALRWVLWAAVLVLAAYVVEDVRGRASLAMFHSKWQDAGFSLRWKDVLPQETVPEEEDFLSTPIMREILAAEDGRDFLFAGRSQRSGTSHSPATKLKDAGFIYGQRLDLGQFLKFPGKNEAENAALYLDDLKSWDQLAHLTAAAQRPRCRFIPRHEEGSMEWNPHAFSSSDITVWPISFRGCAHVALGNAEAAAEDVALLLKLQEFAAQGSDPEYRLMYVGINARLAGEVVWEGIGRNSWSRDQLGQFARQFSTIDLCRRFPAEVKLLCAYQENHITVGWREEPRFAQYWVGTYWDSEWEHAKMWLQMQAIKLAPRGTIDQVILARTKPLMECLIAPGGSASAGLTVSQVEALEVELARYSFYRWESEFDELTRLPTQARTILFYQQQIDLIRLGIALECYRLDKGAYPPSLTALVPAYVPALPEDRFVTGRPVSYELVPGRRYRLYACGHDGIDDGGAPLVKVLASTPKGDVHWQFPAE